MGMIPVVIWWLIGVMGCGGGAETASPKKDAPAAAIAPAGPRGSSDRAAQAVVKEEAGWGAVFWRLDQPWKVGGGDAVASPITASKVVPSGGLGSCGGVAIKGAPARSALAIPAGAAVPGVVKAPAIQAHVVERAAWRLDEVLPKRGKYSPIESSKEPARQRGVHVGSVAKTRRYGAPPILITTGVRECTGAVAILTASGDRALAYDRLPGVCESMRVIPATDMDGDGNREFAVFNDTHVALYRIDAKPGQIELTRLGTWTCDP
jgi:hypothetical protein